VNDELVGVELLWVLKMILLEEVNDVLAVADKRSAREVKGPSTAA
jgi:hypothetical protein